MTESGKTGKGPMETMPPEVDSAVRACLHTGESILAVAGSDMLPDSFFGTAWLAVTEKQVISCAGGERARAFDFSEITEIRCHPRAGCFQAELCVPSGSVTVAWYTNACEESFSKMVSLIRRKIPASSGPQKGDRETGRGHHGKLHGMQGMGKGRQFCERCKRPIPRHLGVCPHCLDKKRIFRRLFGRMMSYWLPMLGGFILMLTMTGVEMAQPILVKMLVDNVIPTQNLILFWWILAGIMAIYSLSSLFSGVRSYLMAWLGEKVVYDLRVELYRHIQELSLEFYDSKDAGWIMDRVTADTSNLQDFIAEQLQDFMRDIIMIVVIIAIMLTMNWELAIMAVLPAPILVYTTHKFFVRTRRLWHSIWRKRTRVSSLLADVIPGVRVVKAFSRESHETDRFVEHSRDYMSTSVRAHRTFSVFYPTVSFITAMGFVLVWGYGGYKAIYGQVTLGTLIAFISYLWHFYGPLDNLSRLTMRLQRAATSAQRVFEVLDTAPSVVNPSDRKILPPISGLVEFDNVWFSYVTGSPVISELTFRVEPGEMIGLVGPSGAGKSTTINLLCRFYDVNGGSIRIDGMDIRDVTLASLRSQIGVVLQEVFLFHGSVAENISYGNPDATGGDIVRAAKAANAHDFIMRFPDGYDTMVGERGHRLAGGERQRIAIARAILKNPRILILDEATSSVDTETEAAIREALDRLIKGRTTIAIAHRFSTLRSASRLVVIDKGKMVECGTHAELLSKENGLFRKLSTMQNEMSNVIAVGG